MLTIGNFHTPVTLKWRKQAEMFVRIIKTEESAYVCWEVLVCTVRITENLQ